ncbi:MAG: HEAT repeat domain-containing protein [Tepidisphaerales bacterium]
MRIARQLLPLLAVLMCLSPRASAYVDLAPTLAKIMNDAWSIGLVEVERFDHDKGILILRTVRDLKGQSRPGPIKQQVATNQSASAVPRQICEWAEPGRRAVIFVSPGTALVCIGKGWYQVQSSLDGWWKLGPVRPDLPLGYYGTVSRLCDAVEIMLTGKTAIITTMPHGADEGASFDVALNRGNLPGLITVQRIRANLRMPAVVMAVSANPAFLVGQGPAGEDEIPALIEKLKSPDPTVRAEAADDLLGLDGKAEAAGSALAQLLDDQSALVRMSAAAALLQITPSHARAVEVLACGLDSSDVAVRRHAARAAGLAGAGAAPLAGRLTVLLADSDGLVRFAALQAVATLGPDAAVARDAVVKLLDDPQMVSDAADALGRMGPAARPALKRLAELFKAEPIALRWAAVRAMSQIGGADAAPAVDFMIGQLKNPSEVDGYNMMVYIGLLGPVAKPALPALENVRIKNRPLRLMAMWSIDPESSFPWISTDPAIAMMREAEFQRFIFEAFLKELGDRLQPAARALARRIMAGTAGEVPTYAYQLMAKYPEEAVGILAAGLSDKDIAQRERSVVALGYMGPAAMKAKEQVASALRNAPTEQEQRLIKWCLREIGG